MPHPGGDARRRARVLYQHALPRKGGLQRVRHAGPVARRPGHQVHLGGDQQRRLRQLALEQVAQRRVRPRQRPPGEQVGQQAHIGEHREGDRFQRHLAPLQQRVDDGARDVHAGAHRLGEQVLRAVRRQRRNPLHQLIVAAAEAAAGDLCRRHAGSGQRAGVDQHLALVIGHHRRPPAAIAQQLAGAADCRGLAAAQETADQMQLHAPIVPGTRAGGQSGQSRRGV